MKLSLVSLDSIWIRRPVVIPGSSLGMRFLPDGVVRVPGQCSRRFEADIDNHRSARRIGRANLFRTRRSVGQIRPRKGVVRANSYRSWGLAGRIRHEAGSRQGKFVPKQGIGKTGSSGDRANCFASGQLARRQDSLLDGRAATSKREKGCRRRASRAMAGRRAP